MLYILDTLLNIFKKIIPNSNTNKIRELEIEKEINKEKQNKKYKKMEKDNEEFIIETRKSLDKKTKLMMIFIIFFVFMNFIFTKNEDCKKELENHKIKINELLDKIENQNKEIITLHKELDSKNNIINYDLKIEKLMEKNIYIPSLSIFGFLGFFEDQNDINYLPGFGIGLTWDFK